MNLIKNEFFLVGLGNVRVWSQGWVHFLQFRLNCSRKYDAGEDKEDFPQCLCQIETTSSVEMGNGANGGLTIECYGSLYKYKIWANIFTMN